MPGCARRPHDAIERIPVPPGNGRLGPSALRRHAAPAASCAEPFYATVMHFRNAMYDAGILPAHRLGKPTISVGNLTTGGTGKTPIVQWLCRRLAAAGQRPAILLRGYKSTSRGFSDEQALLAAGGFPVIADPDRRQRRRRRPRPPSRHHALHPRRWHAASAGLSRF